MTADQWRQFEQDGYVIIRDALSTREVEQYTTALDDTYDRDLEAGHVTADGSLQRLSAVANCPPLAGLVDHPAVFPLVWSVLGWNVHVIHSHYNVHPTLPRGEPCRWRWHQDGSRQNVDLETEPRPRLSVFVSFWLSDVSEENRGNLTVVPGSHLRNWLAGPPDPTVEWPSPEGAVQIRANPGDAVLFDRRIWHTRTPNYSEITRKAVFFGYSYRWIVIRDEVAELHSRPAFKQLSPVQRQLLGEGDGTGNDRWGLPPDAVPLYAHLKERDLLDPDYRPHRRFYP
jgi:ectoine hydroxylase-related dioxygenase (phytanoyl-CoA dioxygenase family)